MTPILAALVMVGTLFGSVSPPPQPTPPSAGVTALAALSPVQACAVSWGQSGPFAALFPVPQVPTGVNVCGPGTLRPAPIPARCTKLVPTTMLQATVDTANPGDRICTHGQTSERLTIKRSGTATAPIQVLGIGQASVKGITIEASHVVLAGFNSAFAVAPGMQLSGDDITVLNNTVTSPRGGDGDGIRFFGSQIHILHNTISDVRNLGGAHADCMQTYATDTPASQNVFISSNRCDRIDNQCLIAEGPHSSAGDGSGKGTSSNFTFTNNFCDTEASQSLMIDDVQNVAVTNNAISGKNDKAFAFANKSTGAFVANNAVSSSIGYLVGMDSSSQQGYQGPPAGGKP
jgi:hypothetical protein